MATHPAPRLDFILDSPFPAVYAEKGVVSFRLTTPFRSGELAGLTAIEGDFVTSSIPDQAIFKLSDGACQQFTGKRIPSNELHLGLNAITLGASQLHQHALFSSELQAYFSWMTYSFRQLLSNARIRC
ncbi:hypothetical protein [Fundicoccus ignavus]|uniref:hypothetical protein n=1 Tax=Fundicoccus ignavus TaxID=2664442 RepID=UPI001561B650|nr:hypothetical protein [Fundicoccus ignavus]